MYSCGGASHRDASDRLPVGRHLSNTAHPPDWNRNGDRIEWTGMYGVSALGRAVEGTFRLLVKLISAEFQVIDYMRGPSLELIKVAGFWAQLVIPPKGVGDVPR